MSLLVQVKPIKPTDTFVAEYPQTITNGIKINPENPIIGSLILNLNFPKTTIIAMIKQGEKFISSSGSTVIEENKILTILLDNQEDLEKVCECLHVDPVNEQILPCKKVFNLSLIKKKQTCFSFFINRGGKQKISVTKPGARDLINKIEANFIFANVRFEKQKCTSFRIPGFGKLEWNIGPQSLYLSLSEYYTHLF